MFVSLPMTYMHLLSQLPPSFRPREHAQDQLLGALLAREGARSTAVTAPKSRISSQGMGGVGKTMLTAAGTAYICVPIG